MSSPLSSRLSQARAWNLVADGYLEHNGADFETFAQRALDLAGVGPGDRVLDVACGPGSLVVPAATRAASVDALDFSEDMLALARRRVAEAGLANATVAQGDGQALPYDDASFDKAFSMFGLMFFPDRARGFSELRRVLGPGGRAVVSSWRPMDDVPFFTALFDALYDEVPTLRPATPPPGLPLSTPDELSAEMSAAGFSVDVVEVPHAFSFPSLDDTLRAARDGFVQVALLADELGAAFDPVWARVCARLADRFDPGPVSFPRVAYFGVGLAG